MHDKAMKNILVVDDDDDIREAICETLKNRGFDCATAADGREALQYLKTHCVDVVLADYRMPVMGGAELLKALMGPAHDPMPVIIMSATGSIAVRDHALALGAVAFLSKPYDNAELIEIVFHAMNAGSRTANQGGAYETEGREGGGQRDTDERTAEGPDHRTGL